MSEQSRLMIIWVKLPMRVAAGMSEGENIPCSSRTVTINTRHVTITGLLAIWKGPGGALRKMLDEAKYNGIHFVK